MNTIIKGIDIICYISKIEEIHSHVRVDSMSTSGKSDWTPEAYRLREEFRKRKELTDRGDIQTYKSIPKKYDVLESEWTLKAYENREKTRQAREATDFDIKNQSTHKIASPEKSTDNPTQLNEIINPQKINEPIFNKTATPLKSAEISNQRIAHIKFTNQPVTPEVRKNQRQDSVPQHTIKKSALVKSTTPNRLTKLDTSKKKKQNSYSDLKKSNSFFRFVSTILIAGSIGFILGIITFSKSTNTKIYQNGVKSRPIVNK